MDLAGRHMEKQCNLNPEKQRANKAAVKEEQEEAHVPKMEEVVAVPGTIYLVDDEPVAGPSGTQHAEPQELQAGPSTAVANAPVPDELHFNAPFIMDNGTYVDPSRESYQIPADCDIAGLPELPDILEDPTDAARPWCNADWNNFCLALGVSPILRAASPEPLPAAPLELENAMPGPSYSSGDVAAPYADGSRMFAYNPLHDDYLPPRVPSDPPYARVTFNGSAISHPPVPLSVWWYSNPPAEEASNDSMPFSPANR